MDKHRAFVVARWLAGCAAGAWTARQFYLVGVADSPINGALHGFYALAGLLATVVLIAPEVAGWIIAPVERLIDAVLSPSESEPPPTDYTLARFYRQHLRLEEACEEYLKIIHYHPREFPAYVEGMLTAGEAQRTDLAARFHRIGRRTFRNAELRRRLDLTLENSRQVAAAAAEGVPALEESAAEEEISPETGEAATPTDEPPVESPGA